MKHGRTDSIFKLALRLILVSLILVSNSVLAVSFTVNSELDLPDANTFDNICETQLGNGMCTLRAALMQSNWTVGTDTINLPSGVYYSTNSIPNKSKFEIDDSVIIIGAGSGSTVIDGMARDTVLVMRQNRKTTPFMVSLSGVTVRNGNKKSVISDTGEILAYGSGGGLHAKDVTQLSLTDIIVENNKSDYAGSGIYINCTKCTNTIINSVIKNNTALNSIRVQTHGGGLFFKSNDASSNLTIINSSISGNRAGLGAGMSVATGTTTLLNSSVNTNFAKNDKLSINIRSHGGGISMRTTATILNVVNSTISGNTSDYESGGIDVWAGQELALYNATITNNQARIGGGVYAYGLIDSRSFKIKNSIIAGNRDLGGVPDCSLGGANFFSSGYNIIGDATDCFIVSLPSDFIGTATNKIDPGLAVLALNGGTTLNHALNSNSPAIDMGDPNGCVDQMGVILTTDQRGIGGESTHDRAQNGGAGAARCDIGAVEFKL